MTFNRAGFEFVDHLFSYWCIV